MWFVKNMIDFQNLMGWILFFANKKWESKGPTPAMKFTIFRVGFDCAKTPGKLAGGRKHYMVQ